MAKDLSIKQQLQLVVQLAHLDQQIDELYEQAGELPERVEQLEQQVQQQQQNIEQLRQRLKEVVGEKTDVHINIQDLERRQKELEDLLYQAKNNRQYDAITRELDNIKQTRQEEESKYATLALQEHNINKQLEQEERQLNTMKEELQQLERQLKEIEDEQEDEMQRLLEERDRLASKLPRQLLLHYERIREYHDDAAVPLRRGSCSGCYSVVPPQTEVELRNYYRVFFCENCGRILYPEELENEPVGSS